MAQFTMNGVTYEEMPDGNVRVVSTAPAPAKGQVFTLPQNPKDARAEAHQAAADQRAAAKDARDAADDARKALEWNATHNPDGSPKLNLTQKPTLTAKERADAIQGYTSATQLDSIINQLETQYKAGPGATSGPMGLKDYLPTTENKQFDSTGNAARGTVGSALGFTGGQLNTATEANMAVGPYLPQAGDRDEVILDKIQRLKELRDLARTRSVAILGGIPDANGNVTPVAQQKADNEVPGAANGAATKPPPTNPSSTPPENGSGNPQTPWDQGPQPGGNTIATGSTQTERSDRLSAQVDAMMNAGAGIETINAALKRQGFPNIRPDQFNAAKKWMSENPGKQYFGADITREKPLPLMSQVAGSTVGSGLASYADAATAGTVGALAGEKGRGALDAMHQVHPDASAVGNILGGITGAAGAEMGIAARAPAALARFAPRIADTLYGGLSGMNTAQEGEGGSGALIGAAAGLGGGLLGEGAVRGVGAVTRGVRNPNVRALRDAGVNLTVGQTVGDSGTIGAAIKKLEDAGTSLPFIGNMIDARRTEGLQGFNDAAFRQAGAPGANITARGAEGMGQVRQSVGDAYRRALDPVTIDANDPALINDLGGVINSAQRIPNVNNAQDAAMAALEARINGAVDPATDMISGRNFQEAYRGLARTGRERANSDYGHEVGQVMRQGQDALAGALERQNPGAFDSFLEANAANRRANVLADALKNAGNQSEELVTPAQLNRADIGSSSRLTGKIESAAGNRPFYDLATAGQAVLPSKLPDSGTATRAGLMTGLGLLGAGAGTGYAAGGGEGAATGTGLGLGATLALALGGTRAAQNAATRMLLDRPDLAVAIGEQFHRNARIGGWTGAGVLTPLVVGQ